MTAKNSKEKTAIDLGDGRRLELYRDYGRDPKHHPVSEIPLVKEPPESKDTKKIVNTALLSALSGNRTGVTRIVFRHVWQHVGLVSAHIGYRSICRACH